MKKLLVLFVMLGLVLTGCTQNSGGDDQGEFRFITRISGDPNNFNPDARSDDNAWPVNQNLFNRLVKLTSDNTFVPDLAKDWEYSDDNMKLTFHLKDNVKWHDGEAFSAEDVKWTYDTIMAESWAKSDSFTNVESIDVPDANTVVFNMKTPDTSFISKLSWYATFIMPKHIYEGTDLAANPANTNPIGTGPFKFKSNESGVAVILEKNPDFFGEVPEIDTLVFQIIPDENTAFEAFKKGEIDYIAALPTANINSLDGDDNYTFVEMLGINRTYITFNLENPDLAKPEVREAIAYALDQQSIFDRVGGVGARATTMISPVFTDYADTAYTVPETNVEKAIELLEAAGYTKNADGYYLELDFEAFESGSFKDIATIIASNLEKAGIKVKLSMAEISAWQTKVVDDRDFQITMLAGYQGPDVSGIDGRVRSDGSTNLAGYNNPTLDEILKKGTQVSDAERKAYYKEAQAILAKDLPIIPILDNGFKTAIKKEFSGVPQQETQRAASSEFTYVKRTK